MAEHGAKAVRDRVAALLIADLPGRIDAMTQLWTLGEKEIPAPDKITSGEPADFALDHRGNTWIEVITPRLMPRTQSMGLNSHGYMINRYRYAARIYVWVLAGEWQAALDLRDRMCTATRDALLAYPTLAIPPTTGDTGFLVHTNTISEEFPDPYRIKNNPRVRAAGLLAYEIIEEYATGYPTTSPVWGRFDSLDLRVTLLPHTRPTLGG